MNNIFRFRLFGAAALVGLIAGCATPDESVFLKTPHGPPVTCLAVVPAFGPFSDPYARSWTDEHVRNVRSDLSKAVLAKSGVNFCGLADTDRLRPETSHVLRISSNSGEIRPVPFGRVVFYRTRLELIQHPGGEVVWRGTSGFGVGPPPFGSRSDDDRMKELANMYYGALHPLAKAGLVSPPGGKVWIP